MPAHVVVVGAGAWGTALAQVAATAGRRVTLVARRPEHAAEIARGTNPRLPGVVLDPAIEITTGEVPDADAVLLVVPAQALRAVTATLSHLNAPLVICAKGIERETGLLPTEVLAETLPRATTAVLSGPNFAAEVARGLPTAVTLACKDAATGRALVETLGTATFRPYFTPDTVGAQVGGALKNVIAIACGVVEGRELGENARAALMTRGLAELGRLNAALGGSPATLAGLSGLGDLTLCCTSRTSRNYALGVALGEGKTVDEATVGGRILTEGAFTAPAVLARARTLDVELPITQAVAAVLRGEADVDDAIHDLLSRPFRDEAAFD